MTTRFPADPKYWNIFKELDDIEFCMYEQNDWGEINEKLLRVYKLQYALSLKGDEQEYALKWIKEK